MDAVVCRVDNHTVFEVARVEKSYVDRMNSFEFQDIFSIWEVNENDAVLSLVDEKIEASNDSCDFILSRFFSGSAKK